jgi:hypothetical protein
LIQIDSPPLIFLIGAFNINFQGVYHDDIRDGEGVLTYPGGRQDVGIWRGTKLIRLRFTIADALYDPYSSSNPLAPLDSSLGASDHKSRGKFGPKGPLEVNCR